jgi:hypothetical protein
MITFAVICIANDIIMNTTAVTASKTTTSFRLDSQLVERLKVLAKQSNRSLNNYVETVLFDIAYDEPNETTRAAIKEAREGKNLEEFDLDAFKKYVASL